MHISVHSEGMLNDSRVKITQVSSADKQIHKENSCLTTGVYVFLSIPLWLSWTSLCDEAGLEPACLASEGWDYSRGSPCAVYTFCHKKQRRTNYTPTWMSLENISPSGRNWILKATYYKIHFM